MEDKLKHLLDSGFKGYRKIKYNSDLKEWITTPETNINTTYLRANFNTQITGGIAISLKKGDKEYFFGLGAKDKVELSLN